MELLISMWLWTMFCVIILPAMIVVTIIYLRKLAKMPPRPPRAEAPAPGIRRRWDGNRRRSSDQDKNAWNSYFAEAVIAAGEE
jgi:hypothetical protein